MTTPFKLSGIISLPEDFNESLEVGKQYTILKDSTRIYPFNAPMEIASDDNTYIGKGVVRELRLTREGTYVTFEVLKIFSEEESRVFTENFIHAD